MRIIEFVEEYLTSITQLPHSWNLAVSYWIWYTTKDVPYAIGFAILIFALKQAGNKQNP